MTVFPVTTMNSLRSPSLRTPELHARGGEMQAGDATDHLSQAFLRKRPLQVVGAQPCLDMSDWNSMVKACERAEKGAFCVALHNHSRPLSLGEDMVKLDSALRAEFQQGITTTLQYVVGNHIKTGQHLHSHVIVLTSVQPIGSCPIRFTQRMKNRG